MSDAADEVQGKLLMKAAVARAVADALREGAQTDSVTYGHITILEELGDDLEGLASRVQVEFEDCPQ